jgi:predicted O-linked N-acetylglucosamine transferase (SPINDLY family)
MLEPASSDSDFAALRFDLEKYVAAFREQPTLAGERLLRVLRLEFAGLWRRYPASALPALLSGTLGDCHEMLMGSGLRDLPLSDQDNRVLSMLNSELGGGWSNELAPACFLGASLFAPAYKLSLSFDFRPLAQNLRPTIFAFLLEAPSLLLEAGDADAFGQYAVRLVASIHDEVLGWRAEAPRREVLELFRRSSFLDGLCLADLPLRPLAEKRAAIIERYLRESGATLDHRFGPSSPSGRIRLGVLAANFDPRPETYFTLGLYRGLDRERFHITLFSQAPERPPLHDHCASFADESVLLPWGDREASVDRIRAADLDVLLFGADLLTRMDETCLLAAHRLARAQVATGLSPATTGLRHMDYFLSPDLAEPARSQAHYKEELVRVPGWSTCFADQPEFEAAMARDRASLGIPEDAVVFASGADELSIRPELDHDWAQILEAVPGSRLVLYACPPHRTAAGLHEQAPLPCRIRRHLQEHGLDGDRLVVIPALASRSDAEELLQICDVYLDTYPHAGRAQVVAPLAVGCPVVAHDGPDQRCRQSAAMLRMLGLSQLVATTDEQYVALAINLGRDAPRRQRMRKRIESHTPNLPFLDTQRHGQALVRIFVDLHARTRTAAS